MSEQHTASVVVKVYPTGERGKVNYTVVSGGPEPVSPTEVLQILEAAVGMLKLAHTQMPRCPRSEVEGG